MNRSTSLRLAAHHAAARANRFDLRVCEKGLDSAALLLVRADRSVRTRARQADMSRVADPTRGIVLVRSPRARSNPPRVGQQTRRPRKVGPGTGRSAQGCRDGHDIGHM